MDKNMAVWLTCLIANDMEKQGKSLASSTCEAIEEKLVNGKYEEVFNFASDILRKPSCESCIEIRLVNLSSGKAYCKNLTVKEYREIAEVINIDWSRC